VEFDKVMTKTILHSFFLRHGVYTVRHGCDYQAVVVMNHTLLRTLS